MLDSEFLEWVAAVVLISAITAGVYAVLPTVALLFNGGGS